MKKKWLQRFTGILISTLVVSSLALSGCGKTGETDSAQEETNLSTESGTQENKDVDENAVFGKITAIEEDTITVALAEMPERTGGERPDGEKPDGEPPEGEMPDGERPEGGAPGGDRSEEQENGESQEEASEGETAQGSETSQGAGDSQENSEAEQPPEMPDGEQPDGNGGRGEMELNLTGEEQVISVTDSTTYQIDGEEGTLEDLQVDDIVTITLAEDGTAESIRAGMGGGMGPGGGQGGKPGSGEEQSESVDTAGANEITDTQSLSGSLESTEADESVVVVKDGGNLTLEDGTVTKTGDTSNTENSEFYGLNAALLVKEGSAMTVSGTDITTEAEGANALFATGENAVLEVQDVTIRTTGNSSRGLDATYGGTVTADNVTISTSGAHCAAVATDRGEGTVTVTGSSFQTSGEGSPCVYSTGNISVSDTTGTASGSSAAVVEGKNSITLTDCEFVCAGKGRTAGGIDDAGVMVYQSMSGDAGEGTGNFTSQDSTLAIDSSSEKYETAPMFFVTNTDAVISLENTELLFGSGILLNASGNDGEWGKEGSNGGTVTFNGNNQSLTGDVTADEISTVQLNLVGSALTGTVNGEQTAKSITVNLDGDSTWELTGDSYVTVLTDADTSCANIVSNGYTVYYDASNEGNAWLNGETLELEGGGSVAPITQ